MKDHYLSSQPPSTDCDVRTWLGAIGVPGIVDIHTHFMPERLLEGVWAYFDGADQHYGWPWPIHYRMDEGARLAKLAELGVVAFAPLVYPHKAGMAARLNTWVRDFALRTPGAVPTATLYPERGVADYLEDALAGGARVVKAHIQVGNYDPRNSLLDDAWATLAESGTPVVLHCGHGLKANSHTGLDIFAEVLRRHPRLTAVLAHAGAPEFDTALDLVDQYPRVYLDVTMVDVPFTLHAHPLPTNWPAKLAGIADRIVFGSDFPIMPYGYATQLAAIDRWAAADPQLGRQFIANAVYHTPAELLGLSRVTRTQQAA